MIKSDPLFLELALVLGLSSLIGLGIRVLKLPLVIAYLLVGVLLSAFQIFDFSNSQILVSLPDIGIAFVLFLVGMELDLGEIKSLGKPIIVAGLGQIIITTLAGFIIAQGFGFNQTESLLLGLGLSFSSTIVVVKMLLEKKDITSLYGKLSLGMTLLEDLVAIIVLMVMTIGSSVTNLNFQSSLPILILLIKGVFLLSLSLGLSKYVLDKVFKLVAQAPELLFLSAIAWCFVFVVIAQALGFSVVIGAFLAGVALASSKFHYEIQGKVKPLRDFFVTIFFVYLGSLVLFQNLLLVLPIILIFTLYAVIVKTLIHLLLLALFGFRKHTIYSASINLSSVSEFSLIVMVLGLRSGITSQNALTTTALTAVLSIIVSSMVISYSRIIYKKVKPFVAFFEHGELVKEESNRKLEHEDHIVLIGAHRIGSQIVRFLKQEKIPFLVLDFNPKVIEALTEKGIHALYGDVGDPEVLEFLNLEKAKLVISTSQDLDDNLMLLSDLKRRKAPAVVITRATSVDEAEKLYKKGSDYVILPEVVSGEYITDALKDYWPSLSYFKDRSDRELNRLAKSQLQID